MKNLLVFVKNHLRRHWPRPTQGLKNFAASPHYPAGVEAYKRLDFLLKLDAAQGALSLAMAATDRNWWGGAAGGFLTPRGFELPRMLVDIVRQAIPSMAKRVEVLFLSEHM